MSNKSGIPIHEATAIPVGAAAALPAVETLLDEFSQDPERASLALDMKTLHLPFQALISVPVQATVARAQKRGEWRLHIAAASKPQLYPAFDGTLTLLPAGLAGSQLKLDGSYVPPLGVVGRAVDFTFLHGAARSSLRRFLRDFSARIAALTRWAQIS